MASISGLTGRLTWAAFTTHNLITNAAVVGTIVAVVGVLGLLTVKRKWGWLWRDWLTTVDPKRLGVMYIIVALLMLVRSGFDVLLLRLQQATASGPGNGAIPATMFQELFSSHGTLMVFFVGMGLMFGLINVILPLQIGAREVAFPFLNAASFWLFAGGMALINTSLGIGSFSAAGWLAYPPLSELGLSPGVGVDYWIWSIQIAGIGSLLAGINFLVTIVRNRCPGMTLMRMPMFVWSVLCSMVLVVLAFPVLTATLALLALDRTIGTHFFTADRGGNLMMYVNLIWAWGHPEVYILILPVFGIFSEIVATFSRKPLFGYVSMVVALIAITILSFSVWVHHFFTMGAGADVNAVFGIMTMVIAIPTGVKIFNWLATMFRGRIVMASPMYWFMGFVGLFTVGGVAGVMLAIPAADFQLHNSLFLVAHFHTMLVSGVLFGDFAGIIYWFPKIFGFHLNERVWKASFSCWFIGFLTVFVPLYILGFLGATRRTSDYLASTGWQPLFIVSGLGALIIAAGVALNIVGFVVSVRNRSAQLDTTGDPWNGRTLEWSTTSPPPPYNFAVIPVVHGRDPFWAAKQGDVLIEAESPYRDVRMPKRTSAGLMVGGLAFLFAFGIVWRIYWLTGLAIAALLAAVVIRTTASDESSYMLPGSDIASMESGAKRRALST
ncbi:MAG: cbb3-type cytochrome c oxidase subunit I [Candidatus Dormibacteraeota bacterium]|nr:cbb3-type cytochrome c oxidase subunit I [Candidatus Dormibacteraeota bacterium]